MRIYKIADRFESQLHKSGQIGPVWRVYVNSQDGQHELADGVISYEEAKKIADDWLGEATNWVNRNEAVSRYGDVLHIEKRPAKLSELGEKVWEAVSMAWSADALELWWSANTSDPKSPDETIEPYLTSVLGGLSKEDIDRGLDELLSKGFIKGKFTSRTWHDRVGRYANRPEGGSRPYHI